MVVGYGGFREQLTWNGFRMVDFNPVWLLSVSEEEIKHTEERSNKDTNKKTDATNINKRFKHNFSKNGEIKLILSLNIHQHLIFLLLTVIEKDDTTTLEGTAFSEEGQYAVSHSSLQIHPVLDPRRQKMMFTSNFIHFYICFMCLARLETNKMCFSSIPWNKSQHFPVEEYYQTM